MSPLIKRIAFGAACLVLVAIMYLSIFGMPDFSEPPPPPVAGACGPAPNTCAAGELVADGGPEWLCNGLHGGPAQSCPLAPPAPEPVPEPEPLPTPTIMGKGVRPDCPDCLGLELALLELGYLNQFLTMVQLVRENASRLPPAYSDVIVEMIREDHPRIAPLIPATFSALADPNAPVGPEMDRDAVLGIIQEELSALTDEADQIMEDELPDAIAGVTIDDVRVVYARPGAAGRQPRAHINVGERRDIITRGRAVPAGDMELVLVEVIPPSEAHERSQVVVKDTLTGTLYTLQWY